MSITGNLLGVQKMNISFNCKVKIYPDGSKKYLVCDKPVFRESGWESDEVKTTSMTGDSSDPLRNIRKARSMISDYAFCNDFKYFVTCSLDGGKVDRYDVDAMTKKLDCWLGNRVKRKGLKYILVPELHKDGAIHYHGLINDSLRMTDSGTVTRPGGRPKKVKTDKQREKMLDAGWQTVYNLPEWKYGFTTAVKLYGEYENAVNYVLKYIGKQLGEDGKPQKIGGRWYYSSNNLDLPKVEYMNVEFADYIGLEDAQKFIVPAANASYIQVRSKKNGLVY